MEPPSVANPTWVLVLYLMMKGASVRQLTIVGVSYKTAWRMARFVRDTLEFQMVTHQRLRAADIVRLLLEARDKRALDDRRLLRERTILFFEVIPV